MLESIRYVTGLRRDDHITFVKRQLGWLTTDMWRIYFSAIVIYKTCLIGQQSYMAELFNTRNRIELGRGKAILEI